MQEIREFVQNDDLGGKMIDFQLDITDLQDLKFEKNKFMEQDILDLGKKHLDAGNRIIIKLSYVNASDDIIHEFTQEEKFEEFWHGLFG